MTRHRLTDPSYLIRHALDLCLSGALDEAATRLTGTEELTVLDIGGRGRPYEGLVSSRLAATGRPLRHFVIDSGKEGDLRAAAEALPLASGCADLVLCTSVLEHVGDPAAAVREMARVLKPGGRCLLTTHGVWFYHPDPEDYWRWTAQGLRTLFSAAGFGRIEIRPVGGTKLALTVLSLNALRDASGEGLLGATVSRLIVAPINALSNGRLLRRIPDRTSRQGELALNYLVVATHS